MLELLVKRHEEWTKVAALLAGDKERGDELLQTFYLYIGELEASGKSKVKLNDSAKDLFNYVYTSLKNLNGKMNKSNNNNIQSIDDTEFFDINSLQDDYDTVIDEKEDFESFYTNIDNFLKIDYKSKKDMSLHYKVGLLKLNYFEGMAMQTIADRGGWSKRHVQVSIESVREMIKDKYQEKYNEYKNKKDIRDGKS